MQRNSEVKKKEGGIVMLQDEIVLYIRENPVLTAVIAGTAVILLLLLVLIQVTRTRREVHKICKKIRKYFDVILTEDVPEAAEAPKDTEEGTQIPVYQTSEERMEQGEDRETEDIKLLMDVISEVF
ncbi:MAG: hypothetical protein HFI83_00170 [Eubacterium sp.]|nr:hypothetical protein [Eubacterium sp.]